MKGKQEEEGISKRTGCRNAPLLIRRDTTVCTFPADLAFVKITNKQTMSLERKLSEKHAFCTHLTKMRQTDRQTETDSVRETERNTDTERQREGEEENLCHNLTVDRPQRKLCQPS